MKKKKFPKVVRFIDYHEMNRLLAYVKKNYFIEFRKKSDAEPFKLCAFVEDLRTNLKVTLKIGTKACTYVTKKDRYEIDQVITGVRAYTTLCRYVKIHEIKKADELSSAIPFLYYNEQYNGTRNQAWCYDLNSAYSDAMNGPMPDTTQVVGRCRVVEEGEIGFRDIPVQVDEMLVGKNDLVMSEPGEFATIIFKAVESPFKRFTEVWYNRKKRAKDKAEKIKAKGTLNYSVGYLQNKNPYIRATIVTRCNNKIKSLMDEYTLYANTDSIVSLRPRPDLELGSGLGEWKLEHKGLFAYKDFNYQWNYEIPTYRGVPKAWFKKNWDILTDDIPSSHNIFELDRETLQLRRIDYGND